MMAFCEPAESKPVPRSVLGLFHSKIPNAKAFEIFVRPAEFEPTAFRVGER